MAPTSAATTAAPGNPSTTATGTPFRSPSLSGQGVELRGSIPQRFRTPESLKSAAAQAASAAPLVPHRPPEPPPLSGPQSLDPFKEVLDTAASPQSVTPTLVPQVEFPAFYHCGEPAHSHVKLTVTR